MEQLRTSAARADEEWKECHAKLQEIQEEVLLQRVESTRISGLVHRFNLHDLFYTPSSLAERSLPDTDSPGNGPRRVAFGPETDTPEGRVLLLDRLPRDSSQRPPHTTSATLAAALAVAQQTAQQSLRSL